MTRDELINSTIEKLKKLPEEKIRDVDNFIDFLESRIKDDELIRKEIKYLLLRSKSYDFLNEEEDLYTVNDLKEKYR
jgi:hypothetical protein